MIQVLALSKRFGNRTAVNEVSFQARPGEIFAMLQLDNVGDRPVGTFSKGMKQKVCLARTFVHDPPALLLDEPCNGLDVSSANSVTDFMMREKQAGKTIIFSSHNMGEVEKLCNQVAIIHHGGLIAQGSVESLKGSYSARFEDTFLRLVGAKA